MLHSLFLNVIKLISHSCSLLQIVQIISDKMKTSVILLYTRPERCCGGDEPFIFMYFWFVEHIIFFCLGIMSRIFLCELRECIVCFFHSQLLSTMILILRFVGPHRYNKLYCMQIYSYYLHQAGNVFSSVALFVC